MSKETLDLWRKHEAESVKSDSIVASCNCNTKTPEVERLEEDLSKCS